MPVTGAEPELAEWPVEPDGVAERAVSAFHAAVSGGGVTGPDGPLPLKPFEWLVGTLHRSAEFTMLPPLLADRRRLPVASVYVELAVSRGSVAPAPRRLGAGRSLAELIEERRDHRMQRRLSLHEALGHGGARRTVILGDPGSGKSSLLRRLALDVAAQGWPRWRLPLFVPLRRYWLDWARWAERIPIDLDLAHYVAYQLFTHRRTALGLGTASMFPTAVDGAGWDAVRGIARAITGIWGRPDGQVVYLLDGLDEVAGDAAAYDHVTGMIGRLEQGGPAVDWVVTSRRAGYLRSLGEDIRYEVVDLDRAGARTLAVNWFREMEGERRGRQAAEAMGAALADEVEADARLSLMAGNPFLLTLLCHLRADSPEPLPLNRAEVYERVIALARQQLRAVTGDADRFGAAELDHLAAFCHHLQTGARDAPRHLFDEDDWARFARPARPPDLHRHYLDSRLLDQWGEAGSGYHLAHLTLHEYLIALHLPTRPPEEVFAHLHDPAWREVIRFHGALLWRHGRHGDFRALVDRLRARIDMAGLVHLRVAEVLGEIDEPDRIAVAGEAYLDTLWRTVLEAPSYNADTAARALGIIAPLRLFERLRRLILDGPRAQAGAAIQRLRYAHRPEVAEFLFGLWRDDAWHDLAGFVGAALARYDDPQLRRRFIEAAGGAPFDAPVWMRLSMVVRHAAHAAYFDVLFARFDEAAGGVAEQLCWDLAASAPPATAPRIAARLARGDLPPDKLLALARVLLKHDTPEGRAWLADAAARQPVEVAAKLLVLGIERGTVDPGLLMDTVRAGGAAESQAYEILRALNTNTALGASLRDAWKTIAAECLGHPSRPVQEAARQGLRRIALQAGDPDVLRLFEPLEDSLVLPNVLHDFARYGVREVQPFLMRILRETENGPARTAVLNGLALRSGALGDEWMALLARLLSRDDEDLVRLAARVLAEKDYERLLPHRDHPAVAAELLRCASETGVLIFEDAYVAPDGTARPLPPRPVRFDPDVALTPLARAAARRPEYARRLRQALGGRLPVLVEPAIRVALAEGGPLAQVLAERVREEADDGIASRVLDLVLPGVPSLGGLALAALDTRTAMLEAADDADSPEAREELGRMHFNRIDWLYGTGRYADGVAAAERAMALFLSRYEDGARGFIALYAAAGAAAAAGLDRLGRGDEALERAKAAADLLGQLIDIDRDLLGPFYADAQLTLAHRLAAAGDHKGAADAAGAAAALYATLPRESGRGTLDWLGEALNAQALALGNLGRHGEAVAVAERAVDLHRRHAEGMPYADRIELAGALNTLALRLRRHARLSEARAAVEEAVAILRAAEADRPGPFADALARTINSLALILSDLGEHDAAVDAARECTRIFDALAPERPEPGPVERGRAWNTLAGCLTVRGDGDEALRAAEQALAILRDGAGETGRDELGLAHYRMAERLHARGDHGKALASARDAVALFRSLHDGSPTEAARDLALALTLLAMIHEALGDGAAAVQAAVEVTVLLRALSAVDPVAFLDDLGMAENNLGHYRVAAGDAQGALAAFRTAAHALHRAARLTGGETPALQTALDNRDRLEAWLRDDWSMQEDT